MITVGIDEVGRGCWAGPLVAGAVVLGKPIAGLKDSKKLSRLQRENLNAIICAEALAIGLGWVWPAEIDKRGITWAVRVAMERAMSGITTTYDEVIIDGNINYFADNARSKAVVKADNSVLAVSAASVVAKVARDSYMAGLGKKYSGYGFAHNVGYGTAVHIAALKKLGVSDIHRRSYKPIKELLA